MNFSNKFKEFFFNETPLVVERFKELEVVGFDGKRG